MFWVIRQTLIFPLMILSGCCCRSTRDRAGCQWPHPSTRWPTWVDAERALFSGEVISPAVAWGWLAALVTAAVGLAVGIRAMVRSAD